MPEVDVTCHRRPDLSLVLGVLFVSLAWACDSAPPRTPGSPSSSPSSSPAPPPPGAVARYHLSGRVTDHAGSPVSGATVELDYAGPGGDSNPPSFCPFTSFCWLTTSTNDRGDYAVEFEAGPWPGRGIGYVYSLHANYETNIQWVPTGSTTAVQNLRLRPIRRISAGVSTVVSVEPDSSLCSDLEDLWVLNSRCEAVQIEAPAGTLVVEARAVEAGAAVPLVFWATSGNYASPPTRPGPGTVSIPAGGGAYKIFVGIPDKAASQRFEVLTLHR